MRVHKLLRTENIDMNDKENKRRLSAKRSAHTMIPMGLEERDNAVRSFYSKSDREQPQSKSVLQADLKEGVMVKKRVMSEGRVESSKIPTH